MNPSDGSGTIGGREYANFDKAGRPMASKNARVILEVPRELQQEFEALARDNERSVPGELRKLMKQAIALKKSGRSLTEADLHAIVAAFAAIHDSTRDGETK